jgi:hypothetical protein
MKHHVLLGLILGLLATARLGGQVLFNVVVNPSTNTVTITANNANPNELPLDINPPPTSNEGITFINFFPDSSAISSIPNNQASLGTLLTEGNSLSLYALPSGTSTLGSLNGYDILNANSLIRPIDSGQYSATTNPSNPGKNLVLFSTATPAFDLAEFTFFKQDSENSITINFSSSLTASSQFPLTLSGGPYYVYSGRNENFSGGFPGEDYSSFLGTYTITVVPEPSTYAAIAGGLGLVAAVLHRRRQRARATAT